jgi:hypothetical protein
VVVLAVVVVGAVARIVVVVGGVVLGVVLVVLEVCVAVRLSGMGSGKNTGAAPYAGRTMSFALLWVGGGLRRRICICARHCVYTRVWHVPCISSPMIKCMPARIQMHLSCVHDVLKDYIRCIMRYRNQSDVTRFAYDKCICIHNGMHF